MAVNYWELVDAAPRTRSSFPVDLGSIGHAGQAETSLMLARHPALVRAPLRRSSRSPRRTTRCLVPEMGETGVLGDPSRRRRRALDDASSTARAAPQLARLPSTSFSTPDDEGGAS